MELRFVNDRLSLEQLRNPVSPGVKPAGRRLVMALDSFSNRTTAGTGRLMI